MALEDVEEQMEELDETEGPKGSDRSEETGDGGGRASEAGHLRFLRKMVLWAAMFAVGGILAYFLLKPYGGKGTALELPDKIHEFGQQTVNLHDGKAGLRVDIAIEVNDARCLAEVMASDSMLRDRAIEILSRKTIDDIDSVVKRNRLKRELLDDFNLELNLEDGRLMKLYFREFFYFRLETPPYNKGTDQW
jgi:flagellar basal body-associated protein FliL